MRQNRGFILNIVAIGVILIIIFLSQTSYFNAQGQEVQAGAQNYWTRATEWIKTSIFPRVSSEVEKRGGGLVDEVNEQKNNLAQNIWEGIVNYLQKNFNYLFKTEVK